jgi:hypothetical protein
MLYLIIMAAEIYRDATSVGATLGITGATVTAVEFQRNGVVTAAATGDPVSIPYSITHLDGDFDVVWTYTVGGDSYTRRETLSVVTPLFIQSELVAHDAAFSTLSGAAVINLERLIRKIIEAYTGQRFGLWDGTLTAYGNGQTFLNLATPALNVTGVTDYANNYLLPYDFRPINGGFAVEKIGTFYDQSIKVPAYEEWVHTSANPITAPSIYPYSNVFADNVRYTVAGLFGWTTVPTDVKEAAFILADLFSCDETTWRDRYIKAIRAADWRFDFDSGAFRGTGSVSADQLLAKYQVTGRPVLI